MGKPILNPDRITNVEFDKILLEFIKNAKPETLIKIHGIYEILSEKWNNDIIDCWEYEKQKIELKKEKEDK